jgi:cytidine deaminase
MEVKPIVKAAYEKAKSAQSKAHAPYSNFHVGSAIKFKNNDEIFSGCNVENASFGATVCAERGAIQTGIGVLGKQEIEFVVVVTNTDPAIGPCGLCLQVISEFAKKETPIYLSNQKEIQSSSTFGELLMVPFSEIPETI